MHTVNDDVTDLCLESSEASTLYLLDDISGSTVFEQHFCWKQLWAQLLVSAVITWQYSQLLPVNDYSRRCMYKTCSTNSGVR